MKKIILSLTLISLLVFPVLAFAADPPKAVDIIATLDNVVNWAFAILVIFAAIMLIVAGFLFVTAEGDATKIKSARDNVMYALIGIAVAFMSRGLVAIVQTLIK